MAVVLGVFVVTKFLHGTWMVVALIPLLILLFRATHGHYHQVVEQLTLPGLPPVQPRRHTAILPIARLHHAIIGGVEYAQSIAPLHRKGDSLSVSCGQSCPQEQTGCP
jgi:hypothetical protein